MSGWGTQSPVSVSITPPEEVFIGRDVRPFVAPHPLHPSLVNCDACSERQNRNVGQWEGPELRSLGSRQIAGDPSSTLTFRAIADQLTIHRLDSASRFVRV